MSKRRGKPPGGIRTTYTGTPEELARYFLDWFAEPLKSEAEAAMTKARARECRAAAGAWETAALIVRNWRPRQTTQDEGE